MSSQKANETAPRKRTDLAHVSDLPQSDTNPYTNARREWAERYGEFIQSAAQWRMVAVVSLVITALAVGGMVYSASQNHFIPYVVQVDKLGVAVAAGRADQASIADPRIIRAQLARWISDTRSVYVDAAAERSAIDSSYAMISRSGSGYNMLNEHFRSNSPFERAEKETVTVQVNTVLPVAGDTWRVEWTETTRGRNGEVQGVDQWQASITILIAPPSDEVSIQRNALGIYIPEFSWTKRS
jgi:type IV secretion system protein TrbF